MLTIEEVSYTTVILRTPTFDSYDASSRSSGSHESGTRATYTTLNPRVAIKMNMMISGEFGHFS